MSVERDSRYRSIPFIDPKDNMLLKKAFQNYKRLRQVYNRQIPYVSDDYVSLISTLERYYKGVLVRMTDGNENSYVIQSSHRIEPVARELIKNGITISNSDAGTERVLDRLYKLSSQYTKARFDIDYPFEEFQRNFLFLNQSMYRLNSFIIEKEKEEKYLDELDEFDM